MAKYELTPVDQKSFYQKAHVKVSETGQVLVSYDTDIIEINWDFEVVKFIRQEWAYSTTTMRHLNAFLFANNMQKTNLNSVRMSIENGEWYDYE